MTRVAVTGAAGFIGGAVVRALTEQGLTVRAHAGPAGTPGPAGWARGEITDPAWMDTLVEGCEAVVHLAGPPWVGRSFTDPAGCARAHTVGTATVLTVARRAGAALVYVSSAEIYGETGGRPVPEDAPRRPRSPYGAAKLGAEALVQALAHEVPALILRPFNVYGPGGHPESALGRIVAQLHGGGPLRVADGRPVRDFVHVEDVARAVIAALPHVSASAPAYNLGSGQGRSIMEVARQAAALAGHPLGVEEVGPRRPNDRLHLVADLRRVARDLRWSARVPFARGLQEMLDENGEG